MAQTTYPLAQARGFPGMAASLRDDEYISRVNTDTEEIPFGVMVQQDGSNEAGALLLTATNNVLLGFAQHAHAYEVYGTSGGIAPGVAVSVKTEGDIFVVTEENVTKGDPVYVRAVAGEGEVAGACRKSTDSTDCILLLGAYFDETSTDKFARVHFDMDAHNAAAAVA